MGRFVTRRYSAWTSLFYAFFFGMLFLMPIVLFAGKLLPTNLPLDGWGTLLFLALVPTLGGFGAYTFGLSHLPASVASILAAFEPVTTAIVAYFMFNEILEPLQLLGAGSILLSVVLLRPRE
jgi:drug/metabolite transporter (DMT)-like permease